MNKFSKSLNILELHKYASDLNKVEFKEYQLDVIDYVQKTTYESFVSNYNKELDIEVINKSNCINDILTTTEFNYECLDFISKNDIVDIYTNLLKDLKLIETNPTIDNSHLLSIDKHNNLSPILPKTTDCQNIKKLNYTTEDLNKLYSTYIELKNIKKEIDYNLTKYKLGHKDTKSPLIGNLVNEYDAIVMRPLKQFFTKLMVLTEYNNEFNDTKKLYPNYNVYYDSNIISIQ